MSATPYASSVSAVTLKSSESAESAVLTAESAVVSTAIAQYRAEAAAKHAEWRARNTHVETPAAGFSFIPTTTTTTAPTTLPTTASGTNAAIATTTSSVSPPHALATSNKTAAATDANGMRYIYVLLCSGGKYYVGETHNVEERFMQHLHCDANGKGIPGAAWTRKHEPIEVVRKFVKQSVHDEDNTTLDFMVEHGIRNVRGGSFCMVHLPRHIRRTIKQRLATIKKLCYRCKLPGHCANNCPTASKPNSTLSSRRSWIECDSEEEEEESREPLPPRSDPLPSNPLFSFDVDEKERPPLPQSEPQRLFDFDPTPATTPATTPTTRLMSFTPLTPHVFPNHPRLALVRCTRCGRNNHSEPQCFAKHHLLGHLLPTK